MFALRGYVLYWVECPIPRILILSANANILFGCVRYWELRLDIEVECQMMFGCYK
jgi:hypothetical protein